VRELVDKATNMVMNYTETESKVREATNDDPWGPSGTCLPEKQCCQSGIWALGPFQCCGSGMCIPDPDFILSGSRNQKQQQKRGVKKLVVKSFFVATNFTKL
jgi:hypothetical protein